MRGRRALGEAADLVVGSTEALLEPALRQALMHLDGGAPRADPRPLRRAGDAEWEGEITEREYAIATYNPRRTHDVTLFILNGERLALIRKHPFAAGHLAAAGRRRSSRARTSSRRSCARRSRRPGSDVDARALPRRRESAVPATRARPASGARTSSSRRPTDEELAPHDTDEIAEARWGTLEELAGPLRERLLATGRAFWRYRVALHDAALEALT